MRHKHSRLRLRHKPAHSRALTRNLVTSVLLYEQVRTTKKRAEVVRPMIDKLITLAKNKQPHVAIRAINEVVTHKNASRKILEVLKDRYSDRPSGFTRVVPVGARHGDGAKLVTLMLIEGKGGAKVETPVEKTQKKQRTQRTQKKVSSSESSESSESSVSSK